MNLLTDKWISVVRADGSEDTIASYEINSCYETNPVQRLNAPRPDFNGALIQFLIGLLQTAFTKLNEEKWDDLYKSPPNAETLQNLFSQFQQAFNFNSDTPSFMQDFDLGDGVSENISQLFIEQSSKKSLEKNTDHFVKRNSINKICFTCAAMAIFTLQINAPEGGRGHRTSLRGGGPLTTLVVSDNEKKKTLWEMVWLNVIPKSKLEDYFGNYSLEIKELSAIFSWLAPTRTSEKASGSTYPSDVHPFQSYWCMPRRIRLDFENTTQGLCDCCNKESEVLIREYITKNYGINYEGGWRHPLSPYRFDDKQLPIALHPQPEGIGYKHWPQLILDHPAAPITAFNHASNGNNIKIWGFGYDMDGGKVRCWYENTIPFYFIAEAIKLSVVEEIKNCLDANKQVLKYLYIALTDTNAHHKFVEIKFWNETEGTFYYILKKIIETLTKDNASELVDIKEAWLSHIQQKARELFDQHVNLQHPELAQIQKIMIAKNKLNKNLFGPKLRKGMGLNAKKGTL